MNNPRTPRFAVSLSLCFAALFIGACAWSPTASSQPAETLSKIAPEVLADADTNGCASIVIMLGDQADVSAAHQMKDQDARGWFVYTTLTEHAARTQAG